jgi:hypothetical protein
MEEKDKMREESQVLLEWTGILRWRECYHIEKYKRHKALRRWRA